MFSLSTSNFDKLVEKATSNMLLEPDWNAIIQICDSIRAGDIKARYALNAIVKKLYSTNPHVNLFALQVLESCVKNCGSPFHIEITTRAFMDEVIELIKVSSNEKVKEKFLELIQTWAHAFRNEPSYRAVKDTLNFLKNEGYKFPALKESDAMFAADSAPIWAEGSNCNRCRVAFSVFQRKHHCRACGQIFCGDCSSKNSTIPKYGIEKEVRVCDDCYDKLNKTAPPASSLAKVLENQSPQKESSSNKSTPTTTANKKSEKELQEEEELQLAIALSKSEAESKERERERNFRMNPQVNQTARNEQSRNDISFDQNPELSRYLNRDYWEKKTTSEMDDQISKSPLPSAPKQQQQTIMPGVKGILVNNQSNEVPIVDEKLQNGGGAVEEDGIYPFINTLRSTIEIFVNRMNSNKIRGRPIANDSAVQSLFMNLTSMHSQLLSNIQEQDDLRVHFEGLQDKLSQIRDARAALDALREEHQEKLRREAEENERIRQQQMAQKLEIMRKKKQEYLQYQREMALQRIQEQEREMQLRQEQKKYMWQQPPQQQLTPQHTVSQIAHPIPYMPVQNMPPNSVGYPPQVQNANIAEQYSMPHQIQGGYPQQISQPSPNPSANQNAYTMQAMSQALPVIYNSPGINTSVQQVMSAPQNITPPTQQILAPSNMQPTMHQQPPPQPVYNNQVITSIPNIETSKVDEPLISFD